MKTKFFVLAFAAIVMAACGGSGSNSSKGCCKGEGQTCQSASVGCCQVKKVISAQVFIKPEHVDAFLAASVELIERSRAEEGCISYSLYQDPNDRTKFLFFEEWKNQAAVDFHFSTEHFANLGKMLEEFASQAPIITIFDTPKEVNL